jgi:hypothetical protein
MWNDTDFPLAYLVTLRCHGTWHRHNTEVLIGGPVTLDASQRRAVEIAIRETCIARQWDLAGTKRQDKPYPHSGLNRAIIIKPERTLSALKANATRQMRQDGWLAK